MIAMGLFATGAAACLVLTGAYDRLFGRLLILPDPLLQVMPKASRPLLGLKQYSYVDPVGHQNILHRPYQSLVSDVGA